VRGPALLRGCEPYPRREQPVRRIAANLTGRAWAPGTARARSHPVGRYGSFHTWKRTIAAAEALMALAIEEVVSPWSTTLSGLSVAQNSRAVAAIDAPEDHFIGNWPKISSKSLI
jgi:hypothetical protein